METLDDLMKKLLEMLPGATVGEDNEGQLIIYTGKKVTLDKSLEDFETE
jgi:hypothetical protein